jgi:hypothetical protein
VLRAWTPQTSNPALRSAFACHAPDSTICSAADRHASHDLAAVAFGVSRWARVSRHCATPTFFALRSLTGYLVAAGMGKRDALLKFMERAAQVVDRDRG